MDCNSGKSIGPVKCDTPLFILCPGFSLSVFFGLFILLASFLFNGVPPAMAMSRFEPWDNRVFIAVAERYGVEAAERLRRVHDLVIENQDKPVLEKLKLANDFLNNFPSIADPVLWERDDYWATPFETITLNGGDCEDIAIAKYRVLRMMGIADNKLGLAYVRNRDSMHHLVLLYMNSSGSDFLILDSQHPDVLPSERRKDIIGIYLFQNDGTLYLFEDDGTNNRKFKARYEDRKLSKWTGAMERERRNYEEYAQYNHGRPLIPE